VVEVILEDLVTTHDK